MALINLNVNRIGKEVIREEVNSYQEAVMRNKFTRNRYGFMQNWTWRLKTAASIAKPAFAGSRRRPGLV
jgi:hypothetical protein